MESGQRKVDALELKRLGELYRQPISHFTGDDDDAGTALPTGCCPPRPPSNRVIGQGPRRARPVRRVSPDACIRRPVMADYASSISVVPLSRLAACTGILGSNRASCTAPARIDVYDTIARLDVKLFFTSSTVSLGVYLREPTPGVLITTQRPRASSALPPHTSSGIIILATTRASMTKASFGARRFRRARETTLRKWKLRPLRPCFSCRAGCWTGTAIDRTGPTPTSWTPVNVYQLALPGWHQLQGDRLDPATAPRVRPFDRQRDGKPRTEKGQANDPARL